MKHLKENRYTFSPILTFMINLIIKTSYFPIVKYCESTTTHKKKEDKSELNNYRPISILTSTKQNQTILRLALFVHISNRLKIGHRFMMSCMPNVHPTQF